jgi:hypothetical protein
MAISSTFNKIFPPRAELAPNSLEKLLENNGVIALEEQTGLLNSKEGVTALKCLYENTKPHMYKAYLTVLVQGVDAVGTVSEFNDYVKLHKVKITTSLYKRVVNWANKLEQYKPFLKTPAGRSGALEPLGSEGLFQSLSQSLESSPVTGSNRNTPTLVENVLNKIHPKFTATIEKYCILIKNRAYLALPAMAFGSLRRVVGALNGILGAFQKIIFNVYKGVIRAIQQFYAYINGIITKIQRMIVSIIEQIIPLDLICLILDAVQVILDDIGFFASMFGGNSSIFSYLNIVQGFVNTASSLATNPLGALKQFIPAEVKQLIDTVDQIGSDPSGFLTDQLNNYGYGYVMTALQGDLYGAIVQKYGGKYPALRAAQYFIGRMDGIAGGLGVSVPDPASMGPMIHQTQNGQFVNENGDPVKNPLKVSVENFLTVAGQEINKTGKGLNQAKIAAQGQLSKLFIEAAPKAQAVEE